MGKPRLIILVRHAQSEGNKNKSIHQIVPDHRVKLTDEGREQAEDAGRRLRHLLNEDDTLQIFTSPYRRTRETTEGILKTLTDSANDDADAPSFSRSKIKVYEEPRLREQDFGNFQPCSAEMERMWQERADYGHFFYRIPNGESAADAYDRISGFNESLWRQFGEQDFPRVCVMVTHGLMTRVFLMKWYHWSVEYFEDLRNINHCEFIVMKLNQETGKYGLENQLRTWTDLKRQRAEREHREVREMGQLEKNPSRRNTLSAFLAHPTTQVEKTSPGLPAKQWGGCVDGCNHESHSKRPNEKDVQLPAPAKDNKPDKNEGEDHALAHQEPTPNETGDGTTDSPPSSSRPKAFPSRLSRQLGSRSGADTPHEMPSDEENEQSYFPSNLSPSSQAHSQPQQPSSLAAAMRKRPPERKPTPEDIERWTQESGMGLGKHADALGDEPSQDEAGQESEQTWKQWKEEDAPDQDGVGAFGERMLSLREEEKEDKSLRGSVY